MGETYNDQQRKALAILEKLSAGAARDTRFKRLTPPLGYVGSSEPSVLQGPEEWEGGFCQGWSWNVTPAYLDTLDIQITLRKENKKDVYKWTQGLNISFEPNNIVYDSPIPTSETWEETLARNIKALRVKSVTDTAITYEKLEVMNKKLTPSSTYSTTVWGFLSVLICGDDLYPISKDKSE